MLSTYPTMRQAVSRVYPHLYSGIGQREENVLMKAVRALFPAYSVMARPKKEANLLYLLNRRSRFLSFDDSSDFRSSCKSFVDVIYPAAVERGTKYVLIYLFFSVRRTES